MDRKYSCYCGLYCENCAVKVKVEPAAKVLLIAHADTTPLPAAWRRNAKELFFC